MGELTQLEWMKLWSLELKKRYHHKIEKGKRYQILYNDFSRIGSVCDAATGEGRYPRTFYRDFALDILPDNHAPGPWEDVVDIEYDEDVGAYVCFRGIAGEE